MATEKDVREAGYTRNSDDTWSKPGSNDKYMTQKGDATENVIIKNISSNGVYNPFDPKKD